MGPLFGSQEEIPTPRNFLQKYKCHGRLLRLNLIAYTSKATHGHSRQVTVALGMVPESPS